MDPLIGTNGFDFIADLGAMMPMRTIGYLLGIPEAGARRAIRDRSVANIAIDSKGRQSGEITELFVGNHCPVCRLHRMAGTVTRPMT